MQISQFFRLLTQACESEGTNPLESNFFPEEVTNLLDSFLGGPSLIPAISVSSHPFTFEGTWLKPKDSLAHAVSKLLGMVYGYVETTVGLTHFKTHGFFDITAKTFLTKNAPFVFRGQDNFKTVLTLSTGVYSVENILTKPNDFSPWMLKEILRVVYPDLQEWLAQNLDEQSQHPERKYEVDVVEVSKELGVNFPAFEQATTPKECEALLKTVRVGKFRRRKKFSRLKKKKRESTKTRQKKKVNRSKNARVHKKRGHGL